MAEIFTETTREEVTFGCQLDSALQRHHQLLENGYFNNDISGVYPQLKGHERSMVHLLGKVVVERMGLMDQLGCGGLAREIIDARRDSYGKRARKL